MAEEGRAARITLRLLTRSDCRLCEEFHADFQRWPGAARCRLELVDVDADAALAARYGARIPVLLHGDEELCATRFRADRLITHPAFR
jgi:hypothetical protein